MNKKFSRVMLMAMIAGLTACSSEQWNTYTANMWGQPKKAPKIAQMNPESTENGALAGSIEKSMDQIDRSKLFHALDSPVGKSTSWTNGGTGITYTVTPTKKIELNGNPYCREYSVSASKGDHARTMTGTACVGADSNWKAMS